MRVFLTVILFISFLAGACDSNKSATQSDDKAKSQDSLTGTATLDTIRIENDELEYETILPYKPF